MKIFSTPNRVMSALAGAAAAVALAGCYVVPLQPAPLLPAQAEAAGPPSTTFTARLYPSNDAAAPYGMVGAVVTSDMNGRGHFSTRIGPEAFSGEATRLAGARDGVANGTGNLGSYISCRYSMNSPTLGSGTCRLNNGATFTMHVGG